jgi:chaperonin GroES
VATPKKKAKKIQMKAKPKAKVKVKAKAKAKPAAAVIAKPKLAVIQPLRDRILVTEIEPPTKTASGLILLAPDDNGSRRAKVIAVGDGRKDKKGRIRPLDVQINDVVLLSPHAGTDVTIGTQPAIIVREEDILGIET